MSNVRPAETGGKSAAVSMLFGLCGLMNRLAGLSMVAMMCLLAADIVLRLLRMPITGASELVGFLGAVTAGFALGQTTFDHGHVAVELLVRRLPPGMQRTIHVLITSLGILLFAMLAYECVGYGNDLKSAGEVSMDLQIPFYPVLYGLAFSALVVCLVLLTELLRVMLGKITLYWLEEN
jgi:TRAP-type C4-dicarboxylate transport system permease small subunit